MTHPGPTTTTPTAKETRRVAFATLIGTSIEWFDFFVYGAAAALVFNKLFFPTANPLTGTLLALSTFGVGFVARPFGGVIFAHFGDRIGRKSMLVLSVVMMGGGTFLVGLMPTYATIGVARPDPARAAADRAGHRPRRGVGRGRDDGRRVRAAAPPGAVRQLPADGRARRHAHREPVAAAHVCRDVRRGVPRLGLAGAVPRLDRAGRSRDRDPAQGGRVAGVRAHPRGREDRAPAGARRAATSARQRPAGRGPAVRREQHVLHPHHVRAHLRHRGARDAAQRSADRGDRRVRDRAGEHAVLRLGLRPVRAEAGRALGLGRPAADELAVLLGARHPSRSR